jgi:hypothetical protein
MKSLTGGLYVGNENFVKAQVANSFEKAHVKQHTRKTKSGKLSSVKEHEDKRQKKDYSVFEKYLQAQDLEYQMENFDQFMQRDEVGNNIVNLLGITGDEATRIKMLDRHQIYDEIKKPEMNKRIDEALETKDRARKTKIDKLKKEVFSAFPLLKDITKRHNFEESILKSQRVGSQGNGKYAVTTPNYYHEEVRLSNEELAELKNFIKMKNQYFKHLNRERKKKLKMSQKEIKNYEEN